jgi:hypothetical protein
LKSQKWIPQTVMMLCCLPGVPKGAKGFWISSDKDDFHRLVLWRTNW